MKTLVLLCASFAVVVAKPGYLGGAGHLGAAGYLGGAGPLGAAGYLGGAGHLGAAGYLGGAGLLGAGYGGIHPGLAAYGPAKIVIGPGGVPLDTPEVAAAKGAHHAAVAETRARDAAINGAAHGALGYGAAPAVAYGAAGYLGGHGLGYSGAHGYHG